MTLRMVGGSYEFVGDLTANGRVNLALADPAKGVKAKLLRPITRSPPPGASAQGGH